MRRVDTVDVEDVQVLPRLRRVGGTAKVEVRTCCATSRRATRDVSLVLRVDGNRASSSTPRPCRRTGGASCRTSSPSSARGSGRRGSRQLYDMTRRRGRGSRDEAPEARGRHLPRDLRRAQDRHAPGRRDPAERQAPQPARRERPRGRPQRGRRALAAHAQRCSSTASQNLGATITRSHYPLHPAFLEALDRAGIMYWVDAPVYQVPDRHVGQRRACGRSPRARPRSRSSNNINHPSILTWSLAQRAGRGGRRTSATTAPRSSRYIREASQAVRELDDTRLVAIDRQSRVGEPLFTEAHRYLDVLGVNEYFGWYRSVIENRPDLPATTTADLSAFLDQLHAANPDLPLVITEFGAEATRSGPVEQKGTFEFQTQVRDGPPRDPRVEARTSTARSTGRCATSACTRPGRAARPPRTPCRPGTTRA